MLLHKEKGERILESRLKIDNNGRHIEFVSRISIAGLNIEESRYEEESD